jgi:2-oxo-4-hydroxy-4-carboxy-5-ureidoimidazoline decarboxylase
VHTLAQINALDRDGFVAVLGGIYEHSPWVAELAWNSRSYNSLDALCATMQAAVMAAPRPAQIALVCAHPELLGKLDAAELTVASRGEQASAGLDRCSAAERGHMQVLNQAYREKFSFPFVVAVRGLNWGGIIARISERLAHHREQEIDIALREIGCIARLRIEAAVRG